MKKMVFVVLFLLISTGQVEKVSAEDTFEVNEHQELSIRQAIELAFPPALKWNEDAQLLQAINIDLDKPGKSIGSNGKRKHWNISFGVPDTNKYFLVTIHDGKIDMVNDLTGEGTSPYPGKDWAKGFNFMLRKDTERNINLLLVIGWNSDQTNMEAAGFNASTGEYIKPN
ncbi:hypothetical protein ACIQ57_15620 [Lysinibacillus xylanilyticus]|uniref:hypothetical protein n=1 Tax=Lysinibacillus xylanilyticus TaxID=582475 RepID=UPI003816C429